MNLKGKDKERRKKDLLDAQEETEHVQYPAGQFIVDIYNHNGFRTSSQEDSNLNVQGKQRANERPQEVTSLS